MKKISQKVLYEQDELCYNIHKTQRVLTVEHKLGKYFTDQDAQAVKKKFRTKLIKTLIQGAWFRKQKEYRYIKESNKDFYNMQKLVDSIK